MLAEGVPVQLELVAELLPARRAGVRLGGDVLRDVVDVPHVPLPLLLRLLPRLAIAPHGFAFQVLEKKGRMAYLFLMAVWGKLR